MSISVGDLIAKLKVDTSDLDKLPAAVDKAGSDITRRFDKVALGMAAAGAAITGAAALAGNAMVESAKGAGKWAETLQQTSERTGLSIKELSGLFVGLNRTGLDFSNVETGFRKLSKVFQDARQDMKEGQESFQLFGKTFTGAESPGEVFRQFADAIKEVNDPLDRVNLASEMFGTRVGQRMLPLLKDGSAGFDAMMKSAEAMGLMIDPVTVAKMGVLDDKFDDVNASMKGLTTALGVQSEPGATRWADLQIGAIQAVTNAIHGLPPVISNSLGVLVEGGLIMGPVLMGMAAFLKSWQLVQPVILGIGAFLATPVGMFLALASAVFIAYSNLDKIHEVLREIGGRFNKFIGENLNAFIDAVKTFGRNVAGYFVQLKDKSIAAIASMVDEISLYLGAKLAAVFDKIREPIQNATKWFKDMYTAVVGRSYVPDMVAGIGASMNQLDSVMVQPAAQATTSVSQMFAVLAERLREATPGTDEFYDTWKAISALNLDAVTTQMIEFGDVLMRDSQAGTETQESVTAAMEGIEQLARTMVDSVNPATEFGRRLKDLVADLDATGDNAEILRIKAGEELNIMAMDMSEAAERAGRNVSESMRTMKDEVVGHSYIPEMVDEIGEHMKKLDNNLAAPARSAAISVEAAFRGLQLTADGVFTTIQSQAAYSVGNTIQTLSGAVAASIQGLNTWSQAGQQMLNALLTTAVNTAMNIVANWAISTAVMLYTDAERATASTAIHSAMESAKTAATTAGEATRLGIMTLTNKVMMAGVIATLGGISAIGTASLSMMQVVVSTTSAIFAAMGSAMAASIVGAPFAPAYFAAATAIGLLGTAAVTAGAGALAASVGTAIVAATTALATPFAQGGIVTGPTLALIGERGPEKVIPLNDRNSGGGMMSLVIELDGRVLTQKVMKYMSGEFNFRTGHA